MTNDNSRLKTIFLMVDTSGSMDGAGIGAVNDTVANIISLIGQQQNVHPERTLTVEALLFGDTARWLYPAAKPIEEFVWKDLDSGGLTAMGAAFGLLRERVAANAADHLPPVTVIITDGGPTDEYEQNLAALLAEPAFADTIRLAIAIGDDADYDVLQQFTGKNDRIHTTNRIDIFANDLENALAGDGMPHADANPDDEEVEW